MKKIVILGGSGYVGSVITKFFLDNKINVINLDNLIYGQNNNFSFSKNKNYKFIKYDLRNKKFNSEILKYADAVVILASLVGDPISNKYKNETKKINIIATKKFIEKSIKYNVKKIFFVSTCSNYGLIKNNMPAKENHKLNPLSPYAKSKVEIEKFLIKKNREKIESKIFILRFATAFGFSERMRFDLTVNEFIKTIMQNKKLIIYDENTWRPYCHVKDFARLILFLIKKPSEKIKNEIFNVGNDKNNFTKKSISKLVLKKLKKGKIIFVKGGNDPRNYKVNFSKIEKKLGFKTKYSINYGINEILRYLKKNKFNSKNFNFMKYGNYRIN